MSRLTKAKKSLFRVVFLVLAATSIAGLAGCAGTDILPTPTLDPQSDAGQGQTLFAANCGSCHVLAEGVVIVGPPLAHIATTAAGRVPGLSAEEYLRDSIVNPDSYVVEGFAPGSMQQNFASQLTSEEVNRIIAFLLTLE